MVDKFRKYSNKYMNKFIKHGKRTSICNYLTIT